MFFTRWIQFSIWELRQVNSFMECQDWIIINLIRWSYQLYILSMLLTRWNFFSIWKY
ncbi:unnamed protein product [Paramecium sonneborni]|uniref:Uncharacterized protein n=1 Tax=Paramecium sonneborni TaxID=65129 RepID=A0A8S1NR44_9CILI|nr:unnamed protein product [Paramecium sonneborni]